MDVNLVEKGSAAVQPAKKAKRQWATPRFRWGVGSALVFLMVWELAGTFQLIDPRYASKPSSIVVAGYTLFTQDRLLYHIYISMTEMVAGFALAVVAGLILGVIMGRSRIIGGLFDPLVMALYATPRVAMIPLFVIWFGVGMGSKIFVVFIGAVFPILINTMTGIRQIDPLWVRAGRSYGATEWQLFYKVLLPGALPAMMTGIRLGWGRGILGVIIGEMYVSMAGLGYMITTAGNAIRTDELFFLVLVVALIGYLATNGFRMLERKLTPYMEEEIRE